MFPLLIPLIIKFRKSDHKPLFKAQCYNTVEDYTQKEPISIGIVAFLFKCEWLNQEKICYPVFSICVLMIDIRISHKYEVGVHQKNRNY